MMNDEWQDSKTVYNLARIDFCSKDISFVLLKLLSTQTIVLLPFVSVSRTEIKRDGIMLGLVYNAINYTAAYTNQFIEHVLKT